jgi:hypothetical protein
MAEETQVPPGGSPPPEPSSLILYCDIPDPKRESVNLRTLIRQALLDREVCENAAQWLNGKGIKIFGNSDLVWGKVQGIIEHSIGDDKMAPFQELTLWRRIAYTKAVYRERQELDKKTKLPTGQIAKRLRSPDDAV